MFVSRYKEIVIDLRENYGFDASSDVVIDSNGGIHNPPEIPPVNEADGDSVNGNSGLTDFKHELESVNRQIEIASEQDRLQKEVDDMLNSM